MKKIFIPIISLLLILLITNCSIDKDPQIRVFNNSSTNVSFKIQTPGETDMMINDVAPGFSTEYHTSLIGNVTATAMVYNQSVSFSTVMNNNYTITFSDTKPLAVVIEQ
ncbi:MAG: hypothetical protein Q8Q47_08150 [Ignavibacteriaceae bacterium]|jgi:hypothetical protein|nr:hypothetical protein [Ignavibacteriaceae bacterium]